MFSHCCHLLLILFNICHTFKTGWAERLLGAGAMEYEDEREVVATLFLVVGQ